MTGAAGQIAYSLLYSIANGDVFGKDQVKQLLQLLNALCSLHTSRMMPWFLYMDLGMRQEIDLH